MQQRMIGGRWVSAIGLGAMPMSIEGRPDEAQAIDTILAALEAGVTLIDTADAYHRDAGEVGHNELLIAKALRRAGSLADDVLVATKAGHLRPGDRTWTQNGDPAYLKRAAKASAQRLGTDTLDLFQFHRPDPAVPFAESMGAVRELLDEGVIAMAGVSNVSVDQIRIADDVLGGRLVSVQNQFSPVHRSTLPELELCAEMGIAFLPWAPVGGSLHARAPKLADEFTLFREIAAERGVSPFQVVLAWELALAPVVIPIPGASRPASIIDSAGAADLVLTAAEVERLSR